jgi:hypothetical protein
VMDDGSSQNRDPNGRLTLAFSGRPAAAADAERWADSRAVVRARRGRHPRASSQRSWLIVDGEWQTGGRSPTSSP